MTSPHPPGEAGFTLVELLVSLMLFGIIATVATALTVSATRSFAATEGALGSVASLEVTRSILAADLGQAAQRPSLAADGTPMPAFTLTPDGFVLVRHRDGGSLPAIEKIAWGFDGARLLRQPFPAIDSAEPGQPLVLATGISAVRIRVAGASGWQEGWAPATPEELPRAVELTLVRANGVPVVMKLLVAA